jgi:mRNA-degrading endonuclease toxin of MazEF toxin-antitoxin module
VPKPPTRFEVKIGLIVWLDDCPPLDGINEKKRPVIVVRVLPGSSRTAVIAVCVSTTSGHREPDSVALPNKAEQPQCRTGLPRPCHAIPRWFLAIDKERIERSQFCGHLSGTKLREVIAAYLERDRQ